MSRPPKYPWEAWFATTTATHVACDDYEISPRSFTIQALNQAKKMEVRLSTRRCQRHDRCVILHKRRRRQVDWTKLLDGNRYPIMYEDLRPVKPESFIRVARSHAAARGLSLEVDRRSHPDGMYMQAIRRRVITGPVTGDKILRKYGDHLREG